MNPKAPNQSLHPYEPPPRVSVADTPPTPVVVGGR